MFFFILNVCYFQLRRASDDRGVQCGRAGHVLPVYRRRHHPGSQVYKSEGRLQKFGVSSDFSNPTSAFWTQVSFSRVVGLLDKIEISPVKAEKNQIVWFRPSL